MSVAAPAHEVKFNGIVVRKMRNYEFCICQQRNG